MFRTHLRKKTYGGFVYGGQTLPLLLTTLFLGMFISCGQKNEKKEKPSGEGKAAISVEPAKATLGEPDPIANPKAIPGGAYTSWGSSFPKSLNRYLDNNSFSAEIMGYLFEPLVTLHSTENRPVGVLAESWEISDDKTTYTFKLYEQAKWSDGKPVTAGDVQFYYDVMMDPKNLTSIFRVSLKRFERPEVVDERTVRIKAKEAHWSNFWDAGGLTAFPKHVWEKVDFNKQNFEFPVVSGPYRLEEVKKNRSITLRKRRDWWGHVKRYNQYKYNFEIIRYKFMTDRNKALEAFKKGDWDVYSIYTSSIWMKKTAFDAVAKGWVVRQKIYNKEPKGFQGLAINLRREKFSDPKVREALSYLLNRELMNEKLMYNQYFLLNSYYPDLYPGNKNPDLPLRGYNPDKARRLLKEAGWLVNDKGELEKGGKRLHVTFLTFSEDDRHLNIYLEDLKSVGIQAKLEKLSMSSVRKRLDTHDFDMYWIAWGASRLRDPEPMWHSSTADDEATANIPGVKDPYIDSLIDAQKTEMDLNKRNEMLRLMDARFHEIIPYVLLWQSSHHRLLYWNKFGTPEHVLDKYNREDAIPTYWWVDPEKEKALEKARAKNGSLPLEPDEVQYQTGSSKN